MLEELNLQTSANMCVTELGIDTYDNCLDKHFFETYPYSVFYFFNARGFRDNEWSENINNSIWCVGDSFTVGLGLMFEHTWHQQLKLFTDDTLINVSLNGASNDWIARKTCYILQSARPKSILLQWSYLHRREHKDARRQDEQRLMHNDPTDTDDIANVLKNIRLVEMIKGNIPVIHSFIPNFSNNQRVTDTTTLFEQMKIDNVSFFPNLDPIDLARDSHHYGQKTALAYAGKYMDRLKYVM